MKSLSPPRLLRQRPHLFVGEDHPPAPSLTAYISSWRKCFAPNLVR